MQKIKNITFDDRQKIASMYNAAGARVADIAAAIGVSDASLYRELEKGRTEELTEDMRQRYNAEQAQLTTQTNLKRRGKRKIKEAPAC